jgi:tetratricopeptide (TPR) repeat protein
MGVSDDGSSEASSDGGDPERASTVATGALGPAEGRYLPGDRFGRYTILDEIGRGGMGVVHRAYDDELRRAVALKILPLAARDALDREADSDGTRLRARLFREAQLLARLSHPNVVAVHDLGTIDGVVFVAMELVDGVTLRRWSRAAPRSAREIVRVFMQAGAGLGAAHAAGIVHGDFKPDNVMLGADGRVRVLDFGLARVDPGATPAGDSIAGPHAPPDDGEDSANVGVLVGTRAYMAPELFDGMPADARSDQYAFCVTLHEALVGSRPFTATPEPLAAEAVRDELFKDVPRGRAVPRHVRRVLERGLARAPSQRYASMTALLADLAKDPRHRAARWAPIAVGAAAILVAVAVGRRREDARHALCAGSEAKVAAVWNDARSRAVRDAFAATRLESAAASANRVVAVLDAYAAEWTTARRDACEATRLRGEQSEALLDLRMACFDQRLAALEAQASVLAAADTTIVGKSALAVADIARIDGCADRAALQAALPLPTEPAKRDAVNQTVAVLSEARALVLTGKYEAAEARAGRALTSARAIPFRPLEAEALFLLGRAEGLLARFAASEEHLDEAARVAIASRRDDTLAEAWTELVRVQGSGELHFAAAHATARIAEAAVERIGGDALVSNLRRQEGDLALHEGKYEVARDKAAEAVRRAEKAFGASDLHVAGVLIQLGSAESSLNRLDEAEASFRRTLAILRAAGLEEHTNVAAAINNLGYIESMRGHEPEALRRYSEARDIWVRCLGPDHPQVADARLNIGTTLVGLGRVDEGLAELEASRALFIALRGRGGIDDALLLVEIATAEAKRHASARALAHYEEAIAIYATLGEIPDRLYAYAGRGELRRSMGLFEGARADLEAAVTIIAANQGEDHPRTLELRILIAKTYFGEGRVAEAIALLRPVRRKIVAIDAPAQLVIHATLTLARMLSNLPGDHAEATALAREVIPLTLRVASGGAALRGRVETWLAAGAPRAPLDEDLTGPVSKP